MKHLLLRNHQCPGDLLMLTAAIRDLHICYPGAFTTSVESSAPEIFENNPLVTPRPNSSVQGIRVGYPMIHRSNQHGLHFINGFIDDLNKRLKLNIKLTQFKPDIYFTQPEIENRIIKEPYWLITSGGKTDFTAKWWDPQKWQKVVDLLKDEVQFVQVGSDKHVHPNLTGVTNLVGRTTLREAMQLVNQAEGICTIITCFMHLAAACNKPCVVVAGGREPYTWEAYDEVTRAKNMLFNNPSWQPPENDNFVSHKFLHTIGQLPCCDNRACWKSKVSEEASSNTCTMPILQPGSPIQPKCMTLIQPEQVVEAVRSYLKAKKEVIVSEGFSINLNDITPCISVADCTAKPLSTLITRGEIPVTICTLLYDEDCKYVDLHSRLLSSLYTNTPANCFKLRIGLNSCSDFTRDIVAAYAEKYGNIEKIYDNKELNIGKHKMERVIYRDQETPISTKWIIWFDDDVYIEREDWLHKLVDFIEHPANKDVEFIGKKYMINLRPEQLGFIQAAPWYKKRPFRGNKVRKRTEFITGAFLCMTKHFLETLDAPDIRLNHNGGDIILGEMAYQNGFKLGNFGYAINCHNTARRGVTIKDAAYPYNKVV